MRIPSGTIGAVAARAARRTGVALAILVLAAGTASAVEELLIEIDELHDQERPEEALEVIDQAYRAATADVERAEVSWRHARSLLFLTDHQLAGEVISEREARNQLEEAEEYAEEAMRLAPNAAEGYYWKAATMGRRGQVRGVLSSLFMAGDVRDYAIDAIDRDPDMAAAYYLLGQLYRELPGGFLSFGDDDYAVGLARKAVDLHEEGLAAGDAPYRFYDFYTQLAMSLWERDWDVAERREGQSEKQQEYANADSALERGFAYEGTVRIDPQDDREEARRLVNWVIEELEALDDRNTGQELDLEDARELRDDWN